MTVDKYYSILSINCYNSYNEYKCKFYIPYSKKYYLLSVIEYSVYIKPYSLQGNYTTCDMKGN